MGISISSLDYIFKCYTAIELFSFFLDGKEYCYNNCVLVYFVLPRHLTDVLTNPLYPCTTSGFGGTTQVAEESKAAGIKPVAGRSVLLSFSSH